MYQFLRNGTGNYNMVGFYDLFCSQVASTKTPKRNKKSTSCTEASEQMNNEEMFAGMSVVDMADGKNTVASTGYDYADPSIVTGGENLIIYGTPGCGKSYKLNARIVDEFSECNRFRVTFHQDYTYTDFVGQILPIVYDQDKVKYEFVPGPFSEALAKAIENKDEKIALVIEEINRGNAASIFGDLFQLLDRDEDGTSAYSLTNVQITGYLKKKFDYDLDYIKIPANLYIYATMNTGDQNVFTLDTAFKRRWKFEKISNKFTSADAHKDRRVPGLNNITWENFVIAINEHMIQDGSFDSEDKQLGKYFITYNQLVDQGEDEADKTAQFAYKVLEYLWNDVAKFDRARWFNVSTYKTLDAVLAAWINGDGGKVFNNEIVFVVTTIAQSSPATTENDPLEETGDEE